MHKVGDLFQSKKSGFLHEWINDKTWLLVEIRYKVNEPYREPYVLHCQQNGRTLNVGRVILDRMIKLNDV